VKLVCAEEVAAVIPNAELCVVKGMGHVLSEKFIQTVTDCIIKNVKSMEEESDKISYYANNRGMQHKKQQGVQSAK